MSRRLLLDEKELDSYLNGRLLPGNAGTDQGRQLCPVTLCSYRLTDDPKWRFSLKGSHRRTNILDWLVAKATQCRLSRTEKLFSFLLTNDQDHHLHYILDEEIHRTLKLVDWNNSPLKKEAKLIFNGFRPRVSLLTEYSPRRFPPVRYIGVGYKDHGSIGTAPSWRDQISQDSPHPSSTLVRFSVKVSVFLGLITLDSLEANPDPTEEPEEGRKRQEEKFL